MPFSVIRGSFHVVSKDKNGKPRGLAPDGDSIHFRPQKAERLDQLATDSHAYTLSPIGSVNLRIEGIDALETHYAGKHQPPTLPADGRTSLLHTLGMSLAAFTPAGKGVLPAQGDGARGFILSKQLDCHGRPIAWVFPGEPPKQDDGTPLRDGERIELHAALAKKSYNYGILAHGLAYPLIYDTMYRELREVMTGAARLAKVSALGVWRFDPRKPAKAADLTDITTTSVLYPKLFRRLVDYYRDYGGGLGSLTEWMRAKDEDDGVFVQPGTDPAHFSTVLNVSGDKVCFKHDVLDLIWRSK